MLLSVLDLLMFRAWTTMQVLGPVQNGGLQVSPPRGRVVFRAGGADWPPPPRFRVLSRSADTCEPRLGMITSTAASNG